jgi:hypothetical protein
MNKRQRRILYRVLVFILYLSVIGLAINIAIIELGEENPDEYRNGQADFKWSDQMRTT